MDKNERRKLILEIVDNQINANTPPETRATLQRLIAEGHSESQAKEMIARVIVTEIYDIMKNEQTFDEQRFIAALNKLPQE